jgi:NADH-quinone oxidoreductase subunit J
MVINIILLSLLLLAAVWAVMRGSLIRAAIALAIVSMVLSILMFRLLSPLAAVFELSVCAGLITVVFMSVISLTKPMTHAEVVAATRGRIKRYWFLPVILIAVGVALAYITIPFNFTLPAPEAEPDVRNILWNLRQLDVLGQVVIILAGVFGVVVLFKDKFKAKSDI